jgi:hypothetical protein
MPQELPSIHTPPTPYGAATTALRSVGRLPAPLSRIALRGGKLGTWPSREASADLSIFAERVSGSTNPTSRWGTSILVTQAGLGHALRYPVCSCLEHRGGIITAGVEFRQDRMQLFYRPIKFPVAALDGQISGFAARWIWRPPRPATTWPGARSPLVDPDMGALVLVFSFFSPSRQQSSLPAIATGLHPPHTY